MKVVILAGGFGTRIQEYAKTIPKPMVRIVNKPILIHIMSHYAKYGFKDFNNIFSFTFCINTFTFIYQMLILTQALFSRTSLN